MAYQSEYPREGEDNPSLGLRINELATKFARGSILPISAVLALTIAEHEILRDIADTQRVQIDRLTDIAEGATGLSEEELLGENLSDVRELPGYGRKVSQDSMDMLSSAVVKIWRQDRMAAGWYENCTGLLVEVEGETLVATADHCFDDKAIGKGGGYIPTAFDISVYDPNMYIAMPPETIIGDAQPGWVSEIAVSTSSDWALIRLHSPLSQDLDSHTALDYERLLRQPAIVGEAAVSFSLPTAAGGELVTGDGVYLGTIYDDASGRYIELVGLKNAETPADDACNFGASGSAAIFAGGHITGPLSFRNNTAYEPGAPENPGDDSYSAVMTRVEYERLLGLNLDQFNTICGYTAADPGTVPVLVDGFDQTLQIK